MKFRKKYIIYPQFQYPIILIQIIIGTISTIAICLKIKYFFYSLKQMGVAAGLSAAHPFYSFISIQENKLIPSMIIFGIISILLMSICFVILSHKLAGPIVRTIGYLKKVAEHGKVEKELCFRQNDFFKELPAAINQALNSLKDKHR